MNSPSIAPVRVSAHQSLRSANRISCLAIHLRGLAIHLRGLAIHLRGLAIHLRGLAIHLRGLAIHLRGLAIHLRGLATHVRGAASANFWSASGNSSSATAVMAVRDRLPAGVRASHRPGSRVRWHASFCGSPVAHRTHRAHGTISVQPKVGLLTRVYLNRSVIDNDLCLWQCLRYWRRYGF